MDCIRPFIGPFTGIVKFLWPCNATHANYLWKLQENGDSLKKALNELKNERDDVQKKVDDAEANPNVPMKRNDNVNRWLQSVTAIEGEVVEILRQVDQLTSRGCFGGCCPDNCWSGYKVGGSIVQYIGSLDELRKKGGFEEIAYKLAPTSVQEEPMNTTVGMESMFEKVWSLLAEDKVRIMGLYGYGGVGKSTLLEQINNVFLKSTTSTHGFDVVILVVVSKVINIEAIQKEIGNRLGLSSSPDRRTIFNALTKKSFVLLLDDIWERIDLQSIGIPPRPENNKSKVVFTTRSEIVCEQMDSNIKFRVECLPWDEALTLFQEKVGNETLNCHPDVPKLAKMAARECGGLPLSLITIGRAMSTKKTVQEWNHTITTLQKYAAEFPGMGDEVLPLLKLSYDSLHNDTIKSCFLYCAVYPEDHSMEKSKLIDYWIGEGFISLNEFHHMDEARNHGHDIIGILKGACLLESGGDEETEVKMHDRIRDLALWIAHDCESRKMDKILIIKTSDLTGERSSSWYNNAERIYLIPPPHDGETEVRPLKTPNLITLILHFRYGFEYRDLSVLPQNFFSFMPHLRVLDLSRSNMERFPISITELLELRYLSLSRTQIIELPEELGKLVKLNYLDLSYMAGLRIIPSGVIGSLLLELRVLNLYRCHAVWDLDEVYKLKHLNHLGMSILSQPDLEKLLSNKNLQMCTRELALYKCRDVKPQSTTLEKLLQLLFNLETLTLLNIEQHHHHLDSSCFQNLSQITIFNCNELKDLTWVGYVPNLKKLDVSDCEELEEIVIVVVGDFGGSTGGGGGDAKDVFKRLRLLRMIDLPKLKSICRSALAFPCLEFMYIKKCPKLKKLPFDSGSNVNNTLRGIEGGPKWWSELQWEKEEGHNNNNNNELLKSKFIHYFHERSDYEC